jgi:hypothetical protein
VAAPAWAAPAVLPVAGGGLATVKEKVSFIEPGSPEAVPA